MDHRRTLRIPALSGPGLLGPGLLGLGLLGAVLAGCGADEPADGAVAGAGTGTEPSSEAAGLPPVSVLDLTTGDEVVLSSYLPADRPVLVWMWSPY